MEGVRADMVRSFTEQMEREEEEEAAQHEALLQVCPTSLCFSLAFPSFFPFISSANIDPFAKATRTKWLRSDELVH